VIVFKAKAGSVDEGVMATRLGPGPRLLLALAVALALVFAGAYLLITSAMRTDQIDSYAQVALADGRGFEELARTRPAAVAIREIDELLDAIGSRPGSVEAGLIAPNRRIVATSNEATLGSVDADPHTTRALDKGVATSGQEEDPGEESANFEFIRPVEFPGGRYALEITYNADNFEAQRADVKQILLLVMVAAVVAVAGLFYLLGGRSLLRNHRLALARATRDGLTDLPNHRAFQDELTQATALAERNQVPMALALLDLDHFKLVNDRHGHPEGDELLRRVASILREGRAGDRSYRIGGDEFAVLLSHTDEEGARIVIRRLSRTLGEAEVSASVGVASLRPGESADELRAEADAALYEAKRRGGHGFTVFTEIPDSAPVTTAAKREAVIQLIEEGEMTTVFQPIWRFNSGDLLGVEALTRPDPNYHLSGPAEAFDIAEKIGVVQRLDKLCATRAIRACPDLVGDSMLFLNLAPKTLELDADGDNWLLEAVTTAGLDPTQIVIEVTERIKARTPLVIRSLHRLREAGFKLALDDVGTGNAGLEMLRMIGADYVKIDRTIVAAAATEPNARAVLMAMATFARQTGAFVIAEGIEDEETLDFIRHIEAVDFRPGCVIQGGQGFELGRPVAAPPLGVSDALTPPTASTPA
jgi:diguanylate cyclase (GGDEF)-like protein